MTANKGDLRKLNKIESYYVPQFMMPTYAG